MASTLFRRRPRGLLWFWAIGIAMAGLLYWTSTKIPALQELLRPLYWVIAAVLAVFTIRWFRPRTGERRRQQRRHGPSEPREPPTGPREPPAAR